MTTRECPREKDVASAARRGAVDAELRGHARECPVCAETIAVTSVLAELAQADVPERSAMDARVLWLKAQLMPRFGGAGDDPAGARQSKGFVWIGVAVCWIAVLGWKWSELRGLLDRLSIGGLLVNADASTLPMASLAVVALMTAVTFAIMFHQVFVEDL